MISAERRKEMKAKAKGMDPLVRIGKNGLTGSVVAQVVRLLEKRKLVKIKFLRAFIEDHDRKKAAGQLAERTGAEIIDQVGFVVVLYKS